MRKLREKNMLLPVGCRVEARLLLCCVQGLWLEGTSDRLNSLLEKEIDWDYVIRKACWHGIVPVVYRSLKGLTEERVPVAVLNELQVYTRMIADRNVLLADELNTILKLFSSKGIEAIPLKGPLLAIKLYGNLELRPAADLDILVRTRDVLTAKRLLLAQGYLPEKDLDSHQEKQYLDSECEFKFYRTKWKLCVELHWRILPQQRFKSDFLWSRAVRAKSGEIQSLWLPPEELFLFLCIHADKHFLCQLRWILDIALVLARHPTMDWDRVKELACGTGNGRTILRALCVVDRILGVPTPQKLAYEVYAGHRNLAYTGVLLGQLFREDCGVPGFREWSQYMEVLGAEWAARRLRRSRLHTLFQYLLVVISPRFVERKAVNLRHSLSLPNWLYRPLRPVWRQALRLLRWLS